jgi:hypothetical protein
MNKIIGTFFGILALGVIWVGAYIESIMDEHAWYYMPAAITMTFSFIASAVSSLRFFSED